MTTRVKINPKSQMRKLLSGDLDFHDGASNHRGHSLHAFAAKFPPQLPHLFISQLTGPSDVVLDPMMGSGTALVEAVALGRNALGFDIDPLAVRISHAKTTLNSRDLENAEQDVVARSQQILEDGDTVESEIQSRFDGDTRKFIDYWFLPETQRELMALVLAIEEVSSTDLRRLLELTFSSIIVTKSGGVSRAMDLAHGRPHRVDSKTPRNAITQFDRKLRQNLSYFAKQGFVSPVDVKAQPMMGDARALPLADGAVDFIVTSPPYANAIDYMRAHKFSLVWLGRSTRSLTKKRSKYIGAERVADVDSLELPESSENTISSLSEMDATKAKILRRYFSEMGQAISEMFRVLRSGRAAVLVVGTSTMRGLDVQTHRCLADIAAQAGFDVVGIGARKLDRNRRMMPVSRVANSGSVIERRMHEEHVIGLWKP